MESGKTGTCRFCGQQLIVHGSEDMTAPQLEEAATMQCDCDDAKAYQETAQRRDKAKQRVKELFGEGAQNYRQPDVMLETMFKAVDMICDKQAKQFVLWLDINSSRTPFLDSMTRLLCVKTTLPSAAGNEHAVTSFGMP